MHVNLFILTRTDKSTGPERNSITSDIQQPEQNLGLDQPSQTHHWGIPGVDKFIFELDCR